MARYHVKADGSMGVCTAREGNCPFGGESGTRHFTNKSEAQAYSEERIKAVEAGKSLGGGLRRGIGGSESPVEQNPSTVGERPEASDGDSKTAKLDVTAHEGLNSMYDPNKYSKEEARALYNGNVRIREAAYNNPYTTLAARKADGDGSVLVLPPQVDSLHRAMMAVSTGMNGNSQADDEFSTDFADPDSYITVNGDGSVDLNGVLKEVDEQEAKKRLRSRKYVDVDKAFKDYISRHKGIASDRREDLDKPADLSHMTRTQVTALYWAMGKRIHGNSALKVNGKIYDVH